MSSIIWKLSNKKHVELESDAVMTIVDNHLNEIILDQEEVIQLIRLCAKIQPRGIYYETLPDPQFPLKNTES